MLLWVLLIGGVALTGAVLMLILSMGQAERRARRSLFRALGLDDETAELLMARNGDVLAELTLVRRHGEASAEEPLQDTLPRRLQPTVRFLHSVEGGAATQTTPAAQASAGEARAPAAERRRLPHPGRQGRP
jgi:hypothetical protein